jgi:hypothetical protein
MVTVSDKRLGVDDGTGKVDYYLADVTSATDYYPFGSTMPGRAFNKNSYRFNFQGQETEEEIWGGEASFFKYRISDNRLGKFFSVDPLAPEYCWNSPFAFSENRVIDAVELEGLEKVEVNKDNSTITISGTYGSFSERAGKDIGGQTYSGGNVPQGVDLNQLVQNAEDRINSSSSIVKYNYEGQDYTVVFDINVIKAKNEEDLKNNQAYKDATADGSFAGLLLFGTSYLGSDIVQEGSGSEPASWSNKGKGVFGVGKTNVINFNSKHFNSSLDINSLQRQDDFLHEFGHDIGLGHLSGWSRSSVLDTKDYLRISSKNGEVYNYHGIMKYSAAGGYVRLRNTQFINVMKYLPQY